MIAIGRAPETPFFRLVQNSSGDLPKHVIAPMPVITALRSSGYLLIAKFGLCVRRRILYQISDKLHLTDSTFSRFGVLIRQHVGSRQILINLWFDA